MPRSGTTLLRVILDTHPEIHCGTELRAVPALASLYANCERTWGPLAANAYGVDGAALRRLFAQLIVSFLEPARRASGKPRVAEKTPWNLLAFPELRRLFPSSPLIHVIRDGRDVVASRLERDRLAHGSRPFDPVAMARQRAAEWAEAMRLRNRLLADAEVARGYCEVRYEDLVRDPGGALRPLFAFLGCAFAPEVLEFHRVHREVCGTEEWSADAVRRPVFASSVGRWRQSLDRRALDAVLEAAGHELSELGYLSQLERW